MEMKGNNVVLLIAALRLLKELTRKRRRKLKVLKRE